MSDTVGSTDPDPPSAVTAGGESALSTGAAEPRADRTRPLDLAGLKCPLPALRTRKALRGLEPGWCLAVTATDPLAGIDVPHAAHEEGAQVLAQQADGSVWRFLIRRS